MKKKNQSYVLACSIFHWCRDTETFSRFQTSIKNKFLWMKITTFLLSFTIFFTIQNYLNHWDSMRTMNELHKICSSIDIYHLPFFMKKIKKSHRRIFSWTVYISNYPSQTTRKFRKSWNDRVEFFFTLKKEIHIEVINESISIY